MKPCLERLEPRVLLATSTPWPVAQPSFATQSVASNPNTSTSGLEHQTAAHSWCTDPRHSPGSRVLSRVITRSCSRTGRSPSFSQPVLVQFQWHRPAGGPHGGKPPTIRGRGFRSSRRLPVLTSSSTRVSLGRTAQVPSWAQSGGTIAAEGLSAPGHEPGAPEPVSGPVPPPPEGLAITSLNGSEGGSSPIYVACLQPRLDSLSRHDRPHTSRARSSLPVRPERGLGVVRGRIAANSATASPPDPGADQ